ncbi:MAG: zinc-ribbon domain containing protein [Pirellula sp.]|jgi:hypothetical protein
MSRRKEKRRIANGGLPPGAVPADTSKQPPISPYGSPKKFYVDIAFKCRDCGRDEVWSAEQQKWFYEEVKGSLYATAIRCNECRKRLREMKQIQLEKMKAAAKQQSQSPDS